MTTTAIPARSGRRERTEAEAVLEAEEQAAMREALGDGSLVGDTALLAEDDDPKNAPPDEAAADGTSASDATAAVIMAETPAAAAQPKPQVWLLLDLFRFDKGADGVDWVHRTNAVKFAALLEAAFGDINGLKIGVLDHASLDLGVEALKQGDPHEAWLSTFRNTLRPDIAERLQAAVAGCFVVLFEPSPAIRQAVEAVAAGVLEVAVHPARLLPELLLQASSTVPAVQAALAAARVSEREIAWRYRCWKARRLIAMQTDETESAWPPFAVLLGQMPHDTAMIREGRFVDLADYEDAIRAAAQRHGLLLVKPHPYAPFTDRTLAMLGRIPGVVFTDANFYGLACDPQCHGVYAISSSGIQEARWFGVPATALAAPPTHLNEGSVETIAPWALADAVAPSIAAHLGLTMKTPVAEFVLPPEPILRPLINETWGRAEPELAVGLPPLRKLPRARLPASAALDSQCLSYGWFPVEDWGAWSQGSAAALTIPWSFGDRVRVILELVAAETTEQAPTVVDVFCEGQRLVSEPLAPIGADPSIVVCDVERPANGAVVSLLLTASHVTRPRPGFDTRVLGLGLVSLQIAYPYGANT